MGIETSFNAAYGFGHGGSEPPVPLVDIEDWQDIGPVDAWLKESGYGSLRFSKGGNMWGDGSELGWTIHAARTWYSVDGREGGATLKMLVEPSEAEVRQLIRCREDLGVMSLELGWMFLVDTY